MPRTTPKKPVDLDAMFGDRIAANIKTAKYAKITLGGQEWTVTDAGSVMASIELFSGDETTASRAFADWIAGMVVEEERPAFQQMLRRVQGLNAEILMEIAVAIQEALADRPTKPSAVSSDTSPSPVIETTSTENSSSPDALPSKTSAELTL